MRYLDYGSTDESLDKVNEQRVKKWEFKYNPCLFNLNCCDKTADEGAELITQEYKTESLCCHCLSQLFDEVSVAVKSRAKNKSFILQIGDLKCNLSRESVFIISRKLESYFVYLYKKHTQDKIFRKNKNLTDLLVSHGLIETSADRERIKGCSQVEVRQYFIYKAIKKDLSNCCNSYPFEIRNIKPMEFIIPELQLYTPVNFSCFCSFGRHEKNHAMLILTDGLERGFTFSFCMNHLYQFIQLLQKVYFGDIKNHLTIGCFSVIKNKMDKKCCIYNTASDYKVTFGKCTFFLSERAMKLLATTVLTSDIAKEYFPVEAQRFIAFKKLQSTM